MGFPPAVLFLAKRTSRNLPDRDRRFPARSSRNVRLEIRGEGKVKGGIKGGKENGKGR